MKAAFFTHYATLAYGANRSLFNLIDGLRTHGVQMAVVSPSDPALRRPSFHKALRERNVEALDAPFAWWSSQEAKFSGSIGRLARNITVAPFLAKRLLDWGSDILYSNTSVIPIGAMVGSLLRRPHVWHLREFGEPDWGLVPDWGIRIHRRMIGKATARIAVSEAVRSYYSLGNTPEHIHVIYNGIAYQREFDELRARSTAHERDGHQTTFAIIGFIRPQKGQLEAIRALALAAKSLHDVRLLVVGGGDPAYVTKCKNLAANLGMQDKVEFWGYIADPYRAILEADAVLMCSRNEAMGRVTAEAMAACRPVIGFDHAGTSELVRHGYNGFLYAGGSERLAERMVRVGKDKAWAKQLGLNGWEWARQACCIETYAESIHNVLLSTLSHRKDL